MILLNKTWNVQFSKQELDDILKDSYSVLKYILENKENLPVKLQIESAAVHEFLTDIYHLGDDDE